jgi:hypothetical protein
MVRQSVEIEKVPFGPERTVVHDGDHERTPEVRRSLKIAEGHAEPTVADEQRGCSRGLCERGSECHSEAHPDGAEVGVGQAEVARSRDVQRDAREGDVVAPVG